MLPEDSVTTWLDAVKEGLDEDAAQKLYQRYLGQLVKLAGRKFGGLPRRMADEEDVAHMALNSFFRGVREGRFPRLHDRHDLWQVLLMLTERRAARVKRDQLSQKRGGGRVRGESALNLAASQTAPPGGMDHLVSREPTPDFACEAAELFQNRLSKLGDAELQKIALWKMEGRTNDEIAQQLGYKGRTVERKLQLIRKIWEQE